MSCLLCAYYATNGNFFCNYFYNFTEKISYSITTCIYTLSLLRHLNLLVVLENDLFSYSQPVKKEKRSHYLSELLGDRKSYFNSMGVRRQKHYSTHYTSHQLLWIFRNGERSTEIFYLSKSRKITIQKK